MKKFLSVLLAMCLCCTAFFVVTACTQGSLPDSGNGDSSSKTEVEEVLDFSGTLSETKFETSEKAAKGFLEEQLGGGGETAKVEFVRYEKKGECSETEISKIELSAAEKTDLKSAEKGEVVYTDNGKEMHRSLFILTFTEYFKYYITGVYEVGDTLTQTDFEQIAKSDLLANVTVNGTFTLAVAGDSNSSVIVIKSKTDALTYTETSSDHVTEELFVKTENDILTYFRMKGEAYDTGYMLDEETKVATITEALESVLFSAQGDHTYLEFSETGFVLRADKKQAYFDDFLEKYELTSYGYTLTECNCEFVFEEGKLVKLIHYNKGTAENGDVVEQKVEFIFSDYGTTSFELPQLSGDAEDDSSAE